MNRHIQKITTLANRINSQSATLHRLVKDLRQPASTGNGHTGNGHSAMNLKLQGRYMGLTRLMSPRKKAHYREIRLQKGVVAAIRAIERDRE